jgi:hypothetical protein
LFKDIIKRQKREKMAYRHNDTLHRHKVRANRLKKAAIITTSIVSVMVAVIGIDWLLGQLSNSNTIVSSENTSSVQSVNISVYRTQYFQFQASEDWVAVASETTDKKYVYVKNNGKLITQKLEIYIDRPASIREADFKVTNVLPVELGELGSFINIGEVSSHCDDSWPADLQRNPSRITHNTVSFVCSPSSKQYNVVVGEYDNDEEISATLSDGSNITVTILYSDLTAYPGPGDIYNIVSSFNTL